MIYISIGLFIIASCFTLVNQHNKNFKRFLKENDSIKFYANGKKYKGKVVKLGYKYVHIETTKISGKLTKIKRIYEEVFPITFFRYKKEFD